MYNLKQYEQMAMATRLLTDINVLFLDTQTTGMDIDDEVIELAIMNSNKDVIYYSLFSPSVNMKKDAIKATGFTDKMLDKENLFKNECGKINTITNSKIIVGWNVKFDIRMLKQTAAKNGQYLDLNNDCLVIDLRDIFESYYDVVGIGLRQLEVHNAFSLPTVKIYDAKASLKDAINLLTKLSDSNYNSDDILLYVSDKKRSDILNARSDINSTQTQNDIYVPTYTKYANAWKKEKDISNIAEQMNVKENTVIINLYKAMDVGYINYYAFGKKENDNISSKIYKKIDDSSIKDFSSFLQTMNNNQKFKDISSGCKENGISIIDVYDYVFRKFHKGLKPGTSIINNDIFNEMNRLVQEEIKQNEKYTKRRT